MNPVDAQRGLEGGGVWFAGSLITTCFCGKTLGCVCGSRTLILIASLLVIQIMNLQGSRFSGSTHPAEVQSGVERVPASCAHLQEQAAAARQGPGHDWFTPGLMGAGTGAPGRSGGLTKVTWPRLKPRPPESVSHIIVIFFLFRFLI